MILTIVTSISIGLITLRVAKIRRKTQQELIPLEVRALSHEVANESFKVSAGLKQLTKAPDPIKALMEAMAGKELK